MLASYGLHQQVVGATRDLGGTLDVVCTRSDLPAPIIDILDIGLSDHRLLRWTSQLHRPPPVYTSTSRRSWRSFDMDAFLTDVQSSPLCDEQQWQGLDGDGLAELYNKTITVLLDHQLVPVHHITCRRRPTSTCFDDDCRKAKRSLRSSCSTEKAARRTGSLSDTNSPAVRSALNDASTTTYFARSVLISGSHVLMRSSHSQVDCGGPSKSCSAVDVYRHLQKSVPRTSIVSSTTRSLLYVRPLLRRMRLILFLHPRHRLCVAVVVSCHLLMWYHW